MIFSVHLAIRPDFKSWSERWNHEMNFTSDFICKQSKDPIKMIIWKRLFFNTKSNISASRPLNLYWYCYFLVKGTWRLYHFVARHIKSKKKEIKNIKNWYKKDCEKIVKRKRRRRKWGRGGGWGVDYLNIPILNKLTLQIWGRSDLLSSVGAAKLMNIIQASVYIFISHFPCYYICRYVYSAQDRYLLGEQIPL